MTMHISADIRALFAEFGIETDEVGAVECGLVIDRFDRPAESATVRDTIGVTFTDSPFEVEAATHAGIGAGPALV
ncbi:hypothetical protein M8542_12030 [Amycolatopsis sp. OK19-0408]|uniref:Uncharacterized protein n=1 Tax=Amycolatopsis iheyensis TaxID=2945988 RepID=A0A9X2NAH0_9PSEU|nr:hypothetical protein [Amycolatopsis iheyensis]MCR6483545.1 hypothetical protein [Amycolatopsis iheyensis]